jgi:hypothetical protein
MTPKAQRIAIAEASQGRIEFFEGVWYYWSGTTRFQCQDNDPLNDLNAMHEAEKNLTDRQWVVYIAKLHDDVAIYPTKKAVASTAPQRAEAFLKTLNLWTDEQ